MLIRSGKTARSSPAARCLGRLQAAVLLFRMLRAASFDGRVYDDLRQDPVALAQAFVAFVAALVAMVLGSVLFVILAHGSVATFGVALGEPFALWLLPAASLFFLGGLARVNDPARGGDRDLLIAIGYSASPGVLWIIPYPLFALIVWGWVMAAMVVAAKAILGVSLLKAVALIFPGIAGYALLLYLAGLLTKPA